MQLIFGVTSRHVGVGYASSGLSKVHMSFLSDLLLPGNCSAVRVRVRFCGSSGTIAASFPASYCAAGEAEQ